MSPDQCGTGRPLASLPPGDREEVEKFAAFLAGDLAYDTIANEYVPVDQAGREGVTLGNRPAPARQPEAADRFVCPSTHTGGDGIETDCIRTDPHGLGDLHHNGGKSWRPWRPSERLPSSWGMDPAVEDAARRAAP